MRSNKAWLQQLGTHLRRALSDLSVDDLGLNGAQISRTDPIEWINKFVVLQAMKTDPRSDEPSHFDGGASLIHMGLTLYGRCRMECHLAENIVEPFVFTPGNVYAGNLCAAEHQVIHESDHDRSDSLEVEGTSLKITVMLRTSLFGAGYGRTIKTPPSPKVVYERANCVVAQHLRDHSLKLPSFEACLTAEEAVSTGCKQPVLELV